MKKLSGSTVGLRRRDGDLLFGSLGLAGVSADAAEVGFDGTWQGRGYTSGSDGCPSFDVHLSVAGNCATGRIVEGQHGIGIDFQLDEKGEFAGTFRTASDHLVRIDGIYDGSQLNGSLWHPRCSAPISWTRRLFFAAVRVCGPAAMTGTASP